MSEDFNRWVPLVQINTKKRHPIWKSYLHAFYGLLDVRNVENNLELPYSYTHNVFQFHLSSELGPFEGSEVNFDEISHQIKCVADLGMISFRWQIWVLLFDISELSGPFGFILYSFEVLISTIELPSISSIGPLTMEIIYFLYFATEHPVRCPSIWCCIVDPINLWFEIWET